MPWFKHENMGGGYMPTLRVRLGRASANSQPIKFIVDSGAAKSLVPRGLVLSLIQDLAEEPEQPTGLLDASGKDLMGLPVDFHLRLADAVDFPVLCERIWVARGLRWSLLGQTWLEQVGANLQNFAKGPRGRSFALYRCPW